MKIIKKNICLIAILSGVVGLSACSQDDALTPDSGTDNGNTIRFTTAIAGFTGSDAAAPAHAPPSTTTVRAASPTATKRRLLESPIQIQGHCLSQKDTPPPTRTERGLPA